MALLVYDGFDYQLGGAGAAIGNDFGYQSGIDGGPPAGPNGWTGSRTTKSAGLLGGSVFNSTGANQVAAFVVGSPTAGPYIAAFRFQMLSGFGPDLIIMTDSAGATQIGLSINASGLLFVWRGSRSTVVATGTTVIILGGWYFVEFKFNINTATGNVTVKLNTVNEIVATNVNTQQTGNANVQQFRLANPFDGSTQSLYDDFYLLDTTGGAPLNDFLGIIRVETLFVTTNNSVTWTPLSSTNASQVLEVNSDNDTTYNATPSAAIDTFNHASLSSTPITIFAAMVTAKMRKDDVPNVTARTKLISGGTTSNGVTNPLTTVYLYYNDMYITDPNTGLAWTAANVNATKIGYERL